jgi:hypothetical protein
MFIVLALPWIPQRTGLLATNRAGSYHQHARLSRVLHPVRSLTSGDPSLPVRLVPWDSQLPASAREVKVRSRLARSCWLVSW